MIDPIDLHEWANQYKAVIFWKKPDDENLIGQVWPVEMQKDARMVASIAFSLGTILTTSPQKEVVELGNTILDFLYEHMEYVYQKPMKLEEDDA